MIRMVHAGMSPGSAGVWVGEWGVGHPMLGTIHAWYTLEHGTGGLFPFGHSQPEPHKHDDLDREDDGNAWYQACTAGLFPFLVTASLTSMTIWTRKMTAIAKMIMCTRSTSAVASSSSSSALSVEKMTSPMNPITVNSENTDSSTLCISPDLRWGKNVSGKRREGKKEGLKRRERQHCVAKVKLKLKLKKPSGCGEAGMENVLQGPAMKADSTGAESYMDESFMDASCRVAGTLSLSRCDRR